MSVSAIILAAGDGTRMKSSIPKVYHKIGGLSLLDHIVSTLHTVGVEDVVAVIREQDADRVLKYPVSRAFQGKNKGTAAAISCGLPLLRADSEWCYILYGDIPLISAETLQKLLVCAQADGESDLVVLAMETDNPHLGRLVQGKDGNYVRAIKEAKDICADDVLLPFCNAGLLVRTNLLKKFLPQIAPSVVTGEYYVTELVRLLHDSGHTCRYVLSNSDELWGVNTAEDLARLESSFQQRMRSRALSNGVRLIAPDTVFFSYDTVIEEDVEVCPYVVFGEGVHISSHAKIEAFCVLEGAHIYPYANVGPFARLRSGSRIGEKVKVGNFVEVKNSEISNRSKVNHLSYIGDTTIGCDSNIGAGVITCNYDGVHKHRTIIGDRAFVGSNSALVAPVIVAEETTVGAGSVITENTEAGSLAIARERQKNIRGWKSRKVK